MQNIAQATVDQDGRFSIVLPDVTQDPILNAPDNRYDGDGRPVSAAQVVIVNSTRLESLRCPENGDECFLALRAIGPARALGISGSDGNFTLQVPIGLMPNDSVWAEGRDANGKSIRTSWPILPTFPADVFTGRYPPEPAHGFHRLGKQPRTTARRR